LSLQREVLFPTYVWSKPLTIDNSQLRVFSYQLKEISLGCVISNTGGGHRKDLVGGMCESLDALVTCIDDTIKEITVENNLGSLEMSNAWININPPGSYNASHHHLGSVLSGVYYIDATANQGNIQFERKDNAEYHIPLDKLNTSSYTSTITSYTAKTDMLYIFPSWLMHSVDSNQSATDRLSISFNYGEKHEN
jgi:uncharacterized protein (TIGR02466 family)